MVRSRPHWKSVYWQRAMSTAPPGGHQRSRRRRGFDFFVFSKPPDFNNPVRNNSIFALKRGSLARIEIAIFS